MKHFAWNPGVGYDSSSLARMQTHFKRPRTPMGEAWFMGSERKLFPELAGDLALLPSRALQRPLEEIASGTSAFGPMEEWTEWYHYLMANLVPRSHESFVDYLLEYLITPFFALYPDGIDEEPYKGFAQDALQTLGRSIMDVNCWNGSEIRLGTILHRSNNNPNQVWRWWDASGDFSASMFFCLKYLPDECVAEWIESVFAIRSPHWRAQVVVWLLGARDLLTGEITWPSQFPENQVPSISWASSHCIRPELLTVASHTLRDGAFIRESARMHVLRAARTYFTQDRYLEWLQSFDEVPYVRDELTHLPGDFEAAYVR